MFPYRLSTLPALDSPRRRSAGMLRQGHGEETKPTIAERLSNLRALVLDLEYPTVCSSLLCSLVSAGVAE